MRLFSDLLDDLGRRYFYGLDSFPDSVPLFTPANVTVQASATGFYGGYMRVEGDLFDITSPLHFSPYWMALIDTPPADWLSLLRVYSSETDRAILKITPEEQNTPEPFRSLLY